MSVINVKKHTTLEVETPQLNRTNIYIKTDNSLAWKDDTGTEHVAATGISPEEVQDIIGSTMADTATVNFTYNDAGNQIYADVIQSGIDHGSISGLGDDDHIQYLNNTRGDARYYTKTQLDAGQLDNRYYTETETNSLLNNKISTSEKGIANGVATLDATVKIPVAQIPALPYAATSHTHTSSDITDFTEASQDASASMITSGTHSAISVAYNDAGNALSLTNTDRGSVAVSTHEAALDPHPQYLTSADGNASYQPLDSDLTALASLAGTGIVTRTGTGVVTTRTITAGAGITISNGDGVTGNPVISSSITQYTDENAQDAIATAFAGGTFDGITLTYNDVANTYSASNTDKGSTAVASHVSAADPHPQYLTATEGDATYATINHTHPDATTTTSGFMSAADKVKLDGLTNDVVLRTTTQINNTSSTTFSTINEHAINVVAGRTYVFEILLRFQTAATTTGIGLSIGGTATGQLAANANAIVAIGTAGLFSGPLTALNGVITTTGVIAANTPYIARTTGIFVATTSGLIYPQFRSEVNGSQVSVLASSVTTFKELA